MSVENGDTGVSSIPEEAVSCFEKGLAHAYKGEYDKAIAKYDEAIEIYPSYSLAYLNRGDAYFFKREFKKSIQDYDVILAYLSGYVDHARQMKEKALLRLRKERKGLCTRTSTWLTSRRPCLGKAIVSIPLFCWLLPLLLSVIVAGTLAALEFRIYAEHVSLISGLMIGFLGVVIAVLVAVLTTAYVQGRGNQVTGFDTFIKALSDFKMVVSEIDRMNTNDKSEKVGSKFKKWRILAEKFATELDEITPAWDGYDYDRILENTMETYVNQSGKMIRHVVKQWDEIRVKHELTIRNMVVGLRIMDEGSVERRLVERLFNIFLSLVALLALSIIVRIIAGLEYDGMDGVRAFVNLSAYLTLPAIAIFNFIALVYSVCMWREDIQKRDDAWKSPLGGTKHRLALTASND